MKKSLLKLAFGMLALSFGVTSIAQTTFNYTGAMQTFIAPATGNYQIEVWGAQGGSGGYYSNINFSSTGGNGGYSTGEVALTAGQTLNIYVGGQGEGYPSATTYMYNLPARNGGWNGGGGCSITNFPGTGGGGASDIRLGGVTLNDRIIVAGGGGGGGNSNDAIQLSNGGAGGGLSGITMLNTTQFINRVPGSGGTQITGFSLGTGETSNENLSGGGGGGYWGGTTGANSTGGGGGSSYIAGLTNATTIAGNAVMPDPNGGNMTGNAGDGVAVITLICNPLTMSVTPADTVCLGTPVTITGTSVGTGTITWDNGITNNVAFPNTVAGVTTYTSTSTDPNDCVAQVVINVLAAKTGSVTNTICNNGSVVVNGNTYDANTPTGTEVISNVGPFNCDSTVTINLNVLAAKTGSVTNTICNNGSVVVNGNTYDANTPTGTEVFTNVGPNNCDSTVTINLNVLAVKTGSVTDALCDGDSIVVNGTTYNAGNLTGTEIFTNVGPSMCDSTVTVNITVLAAKTGTVANAICAGDSMVINGTTYNAGNPTGTEIFTNVGPSMCDSTVTVNLTINPLPTVAIAAFTPDTVCDSDPAINLPAGTPALGTYSGTGVVGTTFDPNTAGVGAHYVMYSFTDSNTCTNMDSTMIVVISCVGIDENGALAGVNIYPNPTNNILNITLGNITSDVNLTLTSVEGKVVYQKNNVSNNKVSVDISNNSKGIYFLKVEANNQYKVYKVIKE